jgi:hypothetical protein
VLAVVVLMLNRVPGIRARHIIMAGAGAGGLQIC